jgi:hypothetical protein
VAPGQRRAAAAAAAASASSPASPALGGGGLLAINVGGAATPGGGFAEVLEQLCHCCRPDHANPAGSSVPALQRVDVLLDDAFASSAGDDDEGDADDGDASAAAQQQGTANAVIVGWAGAAAAAAPAAAGGVRQAPTLAPQLGVEEWAACAQRAHTRCCAAARRAGLLAATANDSHGGSSSYAPRPLPFRLASCITQVHGSAMAAGTADADAHASLAESHAQAHAQHTARLAALQLKKNDAGARSSMSGAVMTPDAAPLVFSHRLGFEEAEDA